MMTQLTLWEKSRLDTLESIIAAGLKTFVDVGKALIEIRDSKLYREDYKTFEDYCGERWGFAKQHAYRLIDAANVIANIEKSPMGDFLPANERQARPLTKLEPEQQREAWSIAIETAPDGKVTGAHVQEVVEAVIYKRPVSYHVSDDSYEWYTPAEYIAAARGVMGGIDLDPATSEEAQEAIQAERYYTKDKDGLLQGWYGRVWLNPPYNMPYIENFIDKVVSEYKAGNVTQATVLTNNSTDTGWFHKLINYPVCFTKGRVQFWNGEQKLATRQGQAVFYLGKNIELFARIFSTFGVVMVQYDYQR